MEAEVNLPISEIIVILVVALLVIKPEKLPEVALTLGRWVKQLRQLIHSFTSGITKRE